MPLFLLFSPSTDHQSSSHKASSTSNNASPVSNNASPIIVSISGGLGNQITQLGLALYLQKHQHRPVTLHAIHFLKNSIKRAYILNSVTHTSLSKEARSLLKNRIPSQRALRHILKLTIKRSPHWIEVQIQKTKHFIKKYFHINPPQLQLSQKMGRIHLSDDVTNIQDKLPSILVQESHIGSSSYKDVLDHVATLPAHKPCYLKGLWHYKEVLDVMKAQAFIKPISLSFEVPEALFSSDLKNFLHNPDSVSLHIRRTDYLGKDTPFYACSQHYYERTSAYIIQNTNNPHFYVFTDDPDYVSHNFRLGVPHTIISGNTDFFPQHPQVQKHKLFWEYSLMASCTHHITANSTFSWTAALLSFSHQELYGRPSARHIQNAINDNSKPSLSHASKPLLCMPYIWIKSGKHDTRKFLSDTVMFDITSGDIINNKKT